MSGTELILQNQLLVEAKPLSHKQGVAIASRWLRNRCYVILPEFVCDNREVADVVGFNRQDSHMIEVKVSRSDFLADKRKHFRAMEEYGIGNYRYYCCPRLLIGVLEIPEGWGLIYIYPSGKARQMLAPERKPTNHKAERTILYSYARRAVVKGHHDSIMIPMNPVAPSSDKEQKL